MNVLTIFNEYYRVFERSENESSKAALISL